jgi:hypothetical protein
MQFTTPSRDAGTIVLSMGGWDTHSSRIPRYATLARPLFMLLLIFLFGPKIINALSRSYSTGPMDQTPALSQGTLTSAYAEPSITFYRGPWRLHRSTPATSTTSPIPPLPYYLHIAARWVIAPLPNSSWVFVSEGGLVGSRDRRQMSEYPIPHGEHCIPASWEGAVNPHFCTLMRGYRIW